MYKLVPLNRILVIDDDELLREYMKCMLLDRGYEAMACDDLDALSVALDFAPDLVIVDINMPHHNGLEVIRLLRRNHISSPAIVCTVRFDDVSVRQYFNMGVIGVISKPISNHRAFVDAVFTMWQVHHNSIGTRLLRTVSKYINVLISYLGRKRA